MLTVLCKSNAAENAHDYVYRVLCCVRLAMDYVEGFVLCLRARRGRNVED